MAARISTIFAIVAAACTACGTAGAQGHPRLFVDPQATTAHVVGSLSGEARRDAQRLARIPTAAWFTEGTPAEVEAKSRALVLRAAAADAVPVMVAYNLPWRDCAQYSAGGARDGKAYLEWIRGLARGIGDRRAILILEPDGLGVIPWHRSLAGVTEWCRPEGLDGSAAEARYDHLRDAVKILTALPRVRLYLDATTSSWLTPAEAASRLSRASIDKAHGFFLNVSNYEGDDRLVPYARWVSDCVALVTRGGLDARRCPDATWSDDAGRRRIDAAYDRLFAAMRMKRDPSAQKRAVIDSSRNGRGTWTPPAGTYKAAEVWCNPPGRGLGRRPAVDPGTPYVDAFLWIKIPGESDGACLRGTKGPDDPARGMRAPAAGGWFVEQARELVALAHPPLPEE